MTEKQLQIRLRLKNDFPYYAYHCLKVRAKNGNIVPFSLNKAQIYLYQKILEHKKKHGKIRMIILKGRQMGISTAFIGMDYQTVSHCRGIRAFILTHRPETTDDLFKILKRFHKNCPIEVRPIDDRDNTKEFNFLSPEGSGYKVGTAGSKGLGRGGTTQIFHGSEVAYWENASAHLDGILQSVPRVDNTKIILESTANGKGNMFHEFWEDAIAKKNEFEPIFIPWYWDEGYRIPIDEEFSLTAEEAEYKELYGLDNEQIYFRRKTIANSHLKELGFQQEYPSNAQEAFIGSGNSFIPGHLVEMARRYQDAIPSGIKFVGVDPAGMGEDRTSIIIRQGRKAYGLNSYLKYDTMEIVGLILKIINEENPDYICIDSIGIGAGVYDRLKELGYGKIIKSINSGSRALNPDRYYNKRSEMWGLMKEWFEEGLVSIPDENSLASDLELLSYKPDSLNRIKLQSKSEISERSPDEADALALTFAFPAIRNNANIGNIFTPNIRI